MGIEPAGVGDAANADDEFIDFQRLCFALGCGVGNADLAALLALAGGDFADFYAELDFQALLVKSTFGIACDLLINSAQKCGHAFKNGDFCAQAPPDRAHFQPDYARADYAEFCGHGSHAQCAVVRQDIFFIKRHARQGAGDRASGDDDVLAVQGVFGFARNADVVATVFGCSKRACAVEEGDFVLFKQVGNAVVVLFNNGVFTRHHFAHVHLHVIGADAMHCKMLVGMFKIFRALQQRL